MIKDFNNGIYLWQLIAFIGLTITEVHNFAKYKLLTLKFLPQTFKILPKWRNFTKSGHSYSN